MKLHSKAILFCVFLLFLAGCSYEEYNTDFFDDIDEAVIEEVKERIVWVKYEYDAKDPDGSYIQSGGRGSGVIHFADEGKLQIFTNRHVVDCGFTQECFQRISEEVKVRTQDGKVHDVEDVLFAPHNLDIALLSVRVPKGHNYNSGTWRDSVTMGEPVVAIGYPTYGVPSVVEFSVSQGTITDLRQLLMDDGFAFESAESDAYTNFGSSGGGLFDASGNLVGINTWVDFGTPYQKSIAIQLGLLDKFDTFTGCEEDGYFDLDGHCYEYCEREQVQGKDGRCYDVCDEFLCETPRLDFQHPNCEDRGYVLGTDGFCHEACGSPSVWCVESNSVCFRGRCVGCPVNQYPFRDGTCRYYE